MFCPQCLKLSILNTKRTCVKCQGNILDNLSCICDKCSKENNICAICLKKINLNVGQNGFSLRRGCSSCGK